MSYLAAIDQLNAMVPELHTADGQPRRKFSLDEIRVLLSALGNPHRRFPAVLIAGTNGKGSTAATLASILTASGVVTGLYTSPHLSQVNERIRVDRNEIPDELFAAFYFKVHDTALQLVREGRLPQMPSFFEILTAQALLYFAQKKVKIAVLEVGMGGRLDATNVVDPLVSVVTDISLDHTEWLGSTIAEITREKAGILRARGTMVTLPQHPEANEVLGEVATALRVRAVSAAPFMPSVGPGASGPYLVKVLRGMVRVDSPLAGAHQQRNLALAIATAQELARLGIGVTAAGMAAGIRQTRWPGRFERLESGGANWILDVAHNPAGVWALRAGLSAVLTDEKPRTLVFGCLRDKPVAEMAQILFPLFEKVIIAPIASPRAAGPAELMKAAEMTGVKAVRAASVAQALELARDAVGDEGVIVVSGSVYLVGAARCLLLESRREEA